MIGVSWTALTYGWENPFDKYNVEPAPYETLKEKTSRWVDWYYDPMWPGGWVEYMPLELGPNVLEERMIAREKEKILDDVRKTAQGSKSSLAMMPLYFLGDTFGLTNQSTTITGRTRSRDWK